MTKLKRLLITPGEPTGIGPDVVIMAAQQFFDAELVAVADPILLAKRAKQIKLPLELVACDIDASPNTHQPGTLKYLSVTPDKHYVVDCLKSAGKFCLDKKAHAIVTGPVNKKIINDSGIKFSGHTEFFADLAQVSQPVMLFVVDDIKLALVTTHLPLKNVSSAITAEKISQVANVLHSALKEKFGINQPTILVAGLNPHAGEGGYLGREEIDIITPAIKKLNASGMNLIGPLPADTIFLPQKLKTAHAILAMYHDQALPVIKFMGFERAVNVTLGLPFIRTSVDHGTAIELAGTGKADASSMIQAIKLAIEMR